VGRYRVRRSSHGEVAVVVCTRNLLAECDHGDARQLERGNLRGRRASSELAERDHSLGAAVAEHVLNLAHAVRHVNGLHNRAARIDGEPCDQKFGNIRQMHRHHVAGRDTDPVQS